MILFAASEVYPYVKTGGLADVAYSLPKALGKEIDIKTLMPLYNSIDRHKYDIYFSGKSFTKTLGAIKHQFDIYYQKKDKSKIFLYNPILCDRSGLYCDEYGEFGDNDLRFGLFSYAVLELIEVLNFDVEAIHINDWQTALIAPLAKEVYKLDAKIVLTIHNLAYQGVFDKSIMDQLNLSWDTFFKPDRFEHFDKVNYLKAGIFYSDVITTVSPSYAKEIQTLKYGEGLQEMLKLYAHKLRGILNGIDYDSFDPKTDKALLYNYDLKNYSLKIKNKKALCKELGLKGHKKALFIFIGRLTWQKGIDAMVQNLHLLAALDANFVFLGSGEEEYENILHQYKNKYPNIYIKVGYDENLSRNLYGACDFLLMPSKFEPCGLNQMITMRYGGVPIVTNTGGLKDSVSDFNSYEKEKGAGVVMLDDNRFEFIFALTKSLSLFSNKKRYKQLASSNMNIDFSWKSSAKEYLETYL